MRRQLSHILIPAGILLFLLTACQPSAPARMALVATTRPGTATATTPATAMPASPTPAPSVTPVLPTPTPSAMPSQTPTASPAPAGPTATPLPTATATPTREPMDINGLPLADFVVLPPEVLTHSRQIFAYGQYLGRDPHHVARLGDSIAATSHFLARFDEGGYRLGSYAYLQPAIDQFAGSFSHLGATARVGLNSWVLFDPTWADKQLCAPQEDLLACEFRSYNPAILLIMLGTNEPGRYAFEDNLRQIISVTVSNGVLPVLITKANRIEGEAGGYNDVLRDLAAEYQIPLLDFDRIADTIPGRGLDQDGVHMITFSQFNYTLDWATYTGYGALNLATLMMLDQLWLHVLQSNIEYVPDKAN